MAVFFDTNVLVYCTDTTAPDKQLRARGLVAQLAAAGEAVVSTQVLIELFHTLTRRQKMPPLTAQVLTQAYTAWPVVDSDVTLVNAAIEKSIQHRLSIWDAMVIEAALRADAQTLYSEDLTHGQRFGALSVVNPFLPAGAR
jgi:predicted nucleic acid-binding protein